MTLMNEIDQIVDGEWTVEAPTSTALVPAQTPAFVPLRKGEAATIYTEPGRPVVTYDPGTPLSEPPRTSYEAVQTTPARAPDIVPDAIVPAVQTVFAMLFMGCASGLLAVALAWDWAVPVAITGAATALAWLFSVRQASRSLMTTNSVQVNGAGKGLKLPGAPVKFDSTAGVSLHDARGAREIAVAERAKHEREARQAKLCGFIQRCVLHGTSRQAHGVTPGTVAYRDYCEMRDTLMQLGIAAWRNPHSANKGWTVTLSEAAACEIVRRHVL